MAEYQHRARSCARQEILDHRAARIALNGRPRPLREFRTRDEVAIWRRGKGIKRSSARWRGPGIVAGQAGGNYWVSMPGSFVKCSPEQLRLRTTEEREADRFLVRDLRAAAASLWPEVGASNRPHQKCYFDITAEDVPPGDLSSIPQPNEVPDCRPGSVQEERPDMAGDRPPQTPESVGIPRTPSSLNHYPSQSLGEEASPGQDVQSINSSERSLTERLSQLSEHDRMSWQESVRRADRLDGHVRKEPPSKQIEAPDKRQRTQEPQQVGGQTFPPSLPHPVVSQNASAIPVPISAGSSVGSSSRESTTQVRFAHDSGSKAVAFSSLDDEEDFVLCIDGEEDQVLLAGGRNELNLKDPKWTSPTGRQKLLEGVRKEVQNVVEDKLALKPLSIEQSRTRRQTESDRIVPSKLVLVEKQDESDASL